MLFLYSLLLFFNGLQQSTLSVICLAPAIYGGERTDSEVIEKVQQRVGQYTQCYTENFTSKDAETVKLRFRFKIKPSGYVSDVHVVFAGTKNQSFVNGIQQVIEKLVFQKIPFAKSECLVEQSILFKIKH